MLTVGNHVSFNHSFPDTQKECSGVVSFVYNNGLGAIIILDESHKEKREVLVLSKGMSFVTNESQVPVPEIDRKSDIKVGSRISFRHEFSSEKMKRTGEVSYVYNNGEGYVVELDPEFRDKYKETFFLSHKMVISHI